jgi:hypothetical protein
MTVSIARTVNPIGLLIWMVYVAAAVLLYLEPAKFWFKSKKEREQQADLLDDF